MRQLGDLEAVVMDRLWAWGRPALVREVLEDLSLDRKLAYTTVMTVMDNLHTKGVLSRVPDGRAYRYTPVRSRAEHSAELIAAVLADSEDRTAPLLRFVEQMTPAELNRLRAALDQAPAASSGGLPARSRRKGGAR
ncbi:MAG: BlaI/MecI/CopY family transcriptional regulator [Sporichthya sp.]|nr:BlaI/MecI/CopY family transcriptional regulator [Sporichthya sp.]